MTDHELDQNQVDTYAASAERLLALVNDDPEQSDQYFYVVWDDNDSAKIETITLMTAEPTGARKHQYWGQFYSAQFKLTETDVDGSTFERFEWCYTGPSETGEPIELRPDALREDFGYELLNTNNIIRVLTDRADFVDDYLTLAKFMEQRGISPVPSLISSVNQLIFRFVQGRPIATAEDGDYDRGKMLELIAQLQRLGSDMPKVTQGIFVGHAMRAIAHRTPGVDHAAALLNTALATNILDDEPRVMNRIFAHGHIYRYPFATDFLHARLERDPNYGSPNYIFGEKRSHFIVEYISVVLGARHPEFAAHMGSIISSSWSPREHRENPKRLYGFMNNLLQSAEAIAGYESEAPMYPPVTNYTEIVPAFKYLLSTFPSEQEGWNDAALDQKCANIVDTVLNAWVHGNVGNLATVTVLYDNTDVREGELFKFDDDDEES